MKFILLIAFFIYLPKTHYENVARVNAWGGSYLTDRMGNVYLIKNHELLKYNGTGIFSCSYSNNYLGNISSADVSDPLRILLFYKEFNQIQLLDNKLTGIGNPVLLDDLGFGQVSMACSSGRGGFWIFDNTSRQLFLYNKTLQLEKKSISLYFVVDKKYVPLFMVEENNFLYVGFPGFGIVMFDAYGTYYKTIGMPEIKNFQVKKGNLLYLRENKLIEFDPLLQNENEMTLPDTSEVKSVRKELDKLYIFKDSGFDIYKIKYP